MGTTDLAVAAEPGHCSIDAKELKHTRLLLRRPRIVVGEFPVEIVSVPFVLLYGAITLQMAMLMIWGQWCASGPFSEGRCKHSSSFGQPVTLNELCEHVTQSRDCDCLTTGPNRLMNCPIVYNTGQIVRQSRLIAVRLVQVGLRKVEAGAVCLDMPPHHRASAHVLEREPSCEAFF